MSDVFKATKVSESSYGIREIEDFINLFAYNIKIPSETVGSARLKSREEIREEHPLYKEYMDGLANIARYLKGHATKVSIPSFAMRAQHIQATGDLLSIVSRLQFFKAFEETMSMYMDEGVGWGFINIEAVYKEQGLQSTVVTIGGRVVDVSKPVRVHLIDWGGNLVTDYDLVDLNANKGIGLPVNLGLVVSDASLGNQNIHDEAVRLHGALNVSDIRKSMTRSFLNYPLIRIAENDDDDMVVDGYETPIFLDADYCHDIEFTDYLAVMVKYNELQDNGMFNNVREFALLNLFRWGINDMATWKKGKAILDAVLKAPTLKEDPKQTIIDRKLVTWGMACIQDIQKRNGVLDEKVINNMILSGSYISKLASMIARAYVKMHVLMVTDVVDDDLGFREARIAFVAKREQTRRFQSMSRLNTDEYKIVELDKEDNIIGVIDVIDIMAVVNYDVDVVVVAIDGDVKASPEQVAFYDQIKKYKPTAIETQA